MTGNKGEWSEIYTLFKILSDKELIPGDSHLNRIEGLVFPIIKILRDEHDELFEYVYKDKLVIITGNNREFKIPLIEFKEHAKKLLAKIKKSTGAFQLPEIEKFTNSFDCRSLKSKSSAKTDINIIIHDITLGTTPKLGFSIKSQLGNPATLLNAGKTTNFIYKFKAGDLSDEKIDVINSINSRNKIKDRLEEIKKFLDDPEFEKTENSIFDNNLTLIDSELTKIVAAVLYKFFSSSLSKVSDLVAEISKENPLRYNPENQHPFYAYKMKRFLTDIALGMMPSKVWKGTLDATGGYLVVKCDGEILCYHIYKRNEFEDYLFNNTRLDTASSSRHDFGKIYRENGEIYFKLNLQIRFIQ